MKRRKNIIITFVKKAVYMLFVVYIAFGPQAAMTLVYAQENASQEASPAPTNYPTASPEVMPTEEHEEPAPTEAIDKVTPTEVSPTIVTPSEVPIPTVEISPNPSQDDSQNSQTNQNQQQQNVQSTPSNQPEVLGSQDEKKSIWPSFSLFSSKPKFQEAPKLSKSTIVYKLRKATYHVNEPLVLLLDKDPNAQVAFTIIDDSGNYQEVPYEKIDNEGLEQYEIIPPSTLRPGHYTLEVKDSSGETYRQDFSWGVLAINTNRSIYKPNQEAKLAMAVLDETGMMVCDANVNLDIFDPQGNKTTLSTENKSIVVNPDCQVKSGAQKPDYEATYTTASAGSYTMKLEAKSQNGIYRITDSFEVRDYVPFDVERTTATRIFPASTYDVVLDIEAFEDFSGTISDFAPEAFRIFPLDTTETYDDIAPFELMSDEGEKNNENQGELAVAQEGSSNVLGIAADNDPDNEADTDNNPAAKTTNSENESEQDSQNSADENENQNQQNESEAKEQESNQSQFLLKNVEIPIDLNAQSNAQSLVFPFEGDYEIATKFGETYDDVRLIDLLLGEHKQGHEGIDFAIPSGTPLKAVDSGEILLAGSGDYGVTIIIQHAWGRTYYGHLSSVSVQDGDEVIKGQHIGYSGNTGISTGPHLHFGLKPNGSSEKNGFMGMVDPMTYLTSTRGAVLGIQEPHPIQKISWNVDLKKGDRLKIGYAYDAPNESPEFYTLGRLQFEKPDEKLTSVEDGASDQNLTSVEEIVPTENLENSTETTPSETFEDSILDTGVEVENAVSLQKSDGVSDATFADTLNTQGVELVTPSPSNVHLNSPAIKAQTSNGNIIFREARYWQIATDAVNAKLRHEINITNTNVTASGDHSALVQIDATKYNGTVTAYLEVVGKVASGTLTVGLQIEGSGSNTDSLSVTQTSYTRVRSGSGFTPSGTQNYQINLSGGTTPMVIAARVVIIQTSLHITSSQTQIEIGNEELALTNTSAAALTYPKYWKYDSSKWDGSPTMYAEVTWKKTDAEFGSTPTFVSAGSIASDLSGACTITPTPPTHQADDIIIVAAHHAAGSAMSTATSGWTEILEVDGTDNFAFYWKRATGAGTAGPDILASSTDCFGVAYIIRGAVTTGTPYEDATASGDGTTAETTPDTAAIDTTDVNRFVVAFESNDDDTAWSSGNPPSGWTADSNLTSASGTQSGFHVISKAQASAGNVASAVIGTLAASELYGAVTLAFLPTAVTTPTVTIKLQEDDGAFGSWADEATIVNASATSGTVTRTRSSSFTPTAGDNYRIVASISNGTNHSYDIYNAKIVIDQTSPTLMEEQYLILNTADIGTGLQTMQTLYDADEWVRVTNVYKHAHDATNSADSTKLYDLTAAADVSNSTVTGANQQIGSSSLTFTDNNNIDSSVITSTGTVTASRILAQITITPVVPTQVSWRFENDDGPNPNTNTAVAAADTALTDVKIGTRINARIQMQIDTAMVGFYTLQYGSTATTSDACSTISSWNDITHSSAISQTFAMSGQSKDVISSRKAATNSNTLVDGRFTEKTPNVSARYLSGNQVLAADTYTEMVYAISTENAAVDTKYCLRLYKYSSSEALLYSTYPALTTVASGSNTKMYTKNTPTSLGSDTTSLKYALGTVGYSNVATQDSTNDKVNGTIMAPSSPYPTIINNPTSTNSEYFGISLSNAGDVNGDGYSDVIVGAEGYTTFRGRAYIFFGSTSPTTPDSTADVVLHNPTSTNNEYFGNSVSTAGDVNGDGYSDVVVGAYGYTSETGRAYIFYGASSMTTPDSAADVVFENPTAGTSERFGQSATTAGDVNGDGYSDVIIGAVRYTSNTGRAYIFYGASSMTTPDSAADVVLENPTATINESFGLTVSTAGDVNGDGYSDVIIEADEYISSRGRAYIFFGASSMTTPDSSADVVLENPTGTNGDSFGTSATTAGDVNGDGYSDVIVGAQVYTTSRGRAYIFFGASSMTTPDSSADVVLENPTATNSESFGYSVSSAGDNNADGYNDVVVGAYQYTTSRGRGYIFYGTSSMTSPDSVEDRVIHNPSGANNESFGNVVSDAGDMNGDGYTDVILGSVSYTTNRGRAHIVYGGQISIENPTSTNTESFGQETSSTGDVNGDGYTDVIVSSTQYNTYQGKVYIFYGSSMGVKNTKNADVVLESPVALSNEAFGGSLDSDGDFNGDGYVDVLVSASGNSGNIGRIYIFYGASSMTTPDSAADVVFENPTGNSADNFGDKSAYVGDVNGDGYSDMAVGAYGYSSNSGRGYVYFGAASPTSPDSSADVVLENPTGTTNEYFGYHIEGARDVNGDGYTDILISAFRYSTYIGRAYIYHGASSMTTPDSSANVVFENPTGTTDDNFGSNIAPAGDVNGDGYSDVIIGARGYLSSRGRAYVYYGASSMTTPDSSANVVLHNPAATSFNYFGHEVQSLDINGDGYSDLAVGAYNYNSSGRIYIFYGASSMTTPDSAADVVLENPTNQGSDSFGGTIGVGDVNGDGYEDISTGTYFNTSSRGRAYVFNGAPSNATAIPAFQFRETNTNATDTISIAWRGRAMTQSPSVLGSSSINTNKVKIQAYDQSATCNGTTGWVTISDQIPVKHSGGYISATRDITSCPEDYYDGSNRVFVRVSQTTASGMFETDVITFTFTGSGPTLSQLMRHGAWFSSDVEQPFYASF